LWVRRHQPEDGVGAVEGLVDDIAVCVRSLYDLDALPDAGCETIGVSCDHADRLIPVEEILEDLVAYKARAGGNDDHEICSISGPLIRVGVGASTWTR